MDKYIDEVTKLIDDIDLRFKIREIVLNAYYDGRAEGIKSISKALDEISKEKKI